MVVDDFKSWLQEGPLKGLKRQHQMSRTANGWIQRKVGKPARAILRETDELDGLTEEELANEQVNFLSQIRNISQTV